MKENYRIVSVMENSTDLSRAGYTVEYGEDVHTLTTDAPVDWASVKTPVAPSPSPSTLTGENTVEKGFSSVETPLTGHDNPEPPPKPFNEGEGEIPTDAPVITAPITVDDLWAEHEKPTEADIQVEQNDPDAPKPQENILTPEQQAAIAPGKDRLGKFTQAEFDETKIFVTIAHTLMQNGNAWLMQQVAGEGDIKDYKAYDKQAFDVWTDLGTQLCAKYGFKPPLEASYMAASGQNMGPAWTLAYKLNREKKKNKDLEHENETLRWKAYYMQNEQEKKGYTDPDRVPPPPPRDYPTEPTPQTAAAEGIPVKTEVGQWKYNPADDYWYGSKSKRKVKADDGEYFFDPERGNQYHKFTGAIKAGRPKGVKPVRKKPQLDEKGHFVNKDHKDFGKWSGKKPVTKK